LGPFGSRPLVRFALRWLATLGMAVWLGGFTFYGGVVVPVLHERFDSLEVGNTTRVVTDALNAIGLVAVLLWWLWALLDHPFTAGPWPRRFGFVLLGATSALLGVLFALHSIMDERLDAGRMGSFYPLHRVYPLVSTVQWAVNVALVGLAAWRTDRPPRADGERLA
jgi:hypothetical protein